MKNKLLTILSLGALSLGMLAFSPVASADDHDRHGWGHRGSDHGWGHRGYDRHGWHGSRWNVGIGLNPWPLYYEPDYYYGYSRPVYVDPPVYAGDSVEADVQRALASRKYYGGDIDGHIGPQTRAAIRAYQADRGLPVTGRIDRELLKALHLL